MDNQLGSFNLETYAGGVSSAVTPDMLPPNQVAWGMNADFRGIKVHTRPNFEQRLFLPPGLVQGLGYFNVQGGMLIAMIAGVPYRLRIGVRTENFGWEKITLPSYNSPAIKQVWMCQTVESFIIQDGQSAAIIYDGSTARRADYVKREVPIGNQMAYGNGRLWVAVKGNQLVAGDIRTDEAGSELLFTETQYLSGGGALIFGDNITALSFTAVTGTSDLGALVVMGRRFTETVRADITSRDSWSTYPGFVTNALRNIGTASGWTLVLVNQDLMWRDALGGIRSLSTALNSGSNLPISREVSRLVEYDSQQLIGFSSGVYFNNRVLMTSSPFLNKQGGVSFRDLISLDFAPTSTMQGQNPPAYNGTWQGVNWTKLISGEFNNRTRAFGVSSDEDGINRLWEFETGSPSDLFLMDAPPVGGDPNHSDGIVRPVASSPIQGFIEYPRIDFGEPKRRKRLARCDLWLSNIVESVDAQVYWRSDNNQKWTFWDNVSYCAKVQDSSTTAPHVWKNLLPEQRPLIQSLSIPDDIDDVTKYALQIGAGFQLRLVWTGALRIERMVLWASAIDSTDYAEREATDAECIENNVTGNGVRYYIPYEVPPVTPKLLGVLAESGYTTDSDVYINAPFGASTIGLVADAEGEVINIASISLTGGITTGEVPPIEVIWDTPYDFALDTASNGTVVLVHDGSNSPTTLHITEVFPPVNANLGVDEGCGDTNFDSPAIQEVSPPFPVIRGTDFITDGDEITITSMDITGGISEVKFSYPPYDPVSFPMLTSDAEIRYKVTAAGAITVHHNGLNSPFIRQIVIT